jgi:hypothetical protein
MARILGSGIKLASIPLATQVVPFSPESGEPPVTPPGPNPRSGGGGGGLGWLGLLLLALGLGGGMLTSPPPPQAGIPPATLTSSTSYVIPAEQPPVMRGGLLR